MYPDIRPQIQFRHLSGFPGRTLVISPHCDDETIGCGGSIARSLAAGCEVRIVFAAVSETPGDEIDDVRRREARSASACLGATDLRFLAHRIRAIDTDILAGDIAAELQTFAPDVLMVPWYGDNHLDHWAVNVALERCAERIERSAMAVLAYEVWTPLPVESLIDITREMPVKMRALREYPSQLRSWRYEPMVAALNAFRACSKVPPSFGRVKFAEAFVHRRLEEYVSLVAHRRQHMTPRVMKTRPSPPKN